MKQRPQHEAIAPPLWRPWWRWFISGLLAFHVTAVFLGPFAFSTRTPNDTSSEFARPLMQVFRPYVQAAFLDHGYAFFAPDPGPSHLVRYKIDFQDGRPSVEGTFPDLKSERPRLLYHRHFMLSEQLHSSFVPPALESANAPPPGQLSDVEQRRWNELLAQQVDQRRQNWQRDRATYEARWQAFEEHLKHTYQGDSVSMVRIEHRPPTPQEVQELGFRLDDKRLYTTLTKDNSEGSTWLQRLWRIFSRSLNDEASGDRP